MHSASFFEEEDEQPSKTEQRLSKILGNKADAITEGLGQVGGIILTGGIAGALGAGGAAVCAGSGI